MGEGRTQCIINKGPSSQGYGFSSSHIWMWELDYKESWALKNWCFWTVVLEKTLESPWTARRSNQSILKEISPECSLEGLMLSWSSNTLATWCEELTQWKRSWCWERLKAGGEGDTEDEMVGWHHWLNGHESEQTPGDTVKDRKAWCAAVHGVTKSQTWLSDWTELNWLWPGWGDISL